MKNILGKFLVGFLKIGHLFFVLFFKGDSYFFSGKMKKSRKWPPYDIRVISFIGNLQ